MKNKPDKKSKVQSKQKRKIVIADKEWLSHGSERRKYQRLSLVVKARYKVIGKKNAGGEAECVNVSGGGINVRTKHPLAVGDRVEVTFSMPNSEKPITAEGKVIWTEKLNSKVKGGIQFTNIKFKPEFMEFFCEEMLNSSLDKEI